ncbi:hypothetical protein H6P81_002315 [Aristolochia fimbriata]|uniref:Uncharacterized protein n=1 Tax=Aristolochia fimbriata TaxID=158543 RepID=A0AAV7F9F9_ARIFI|nr:hypothetical protein H6P81_002315 [Aristolochia fimbriata]
MGDDSFLGISQPVQKAVFRDQGSVAMYEEERHLSGKPGRLILLIFLISIGGRSIAGDSIETDKEVLLQLSSYFQPDNRVTRAQYVEWGKSDLPICRWPRILCRNGRVASVDLSDSDVSGNFFPNFSALTHLSSLDISKNAISGRIPEDLNRCKNLRYLNLSHNLLQGELNLTGLRRLETLDLAVNRIGGTIQANFPVICGRLVSLNLSSNSFAGNLSDSNFDGCPALRYLDLSSNGFVGRLWAGFARLRRFCASENGLAGEVSPKMFANSCNLEVLDLSENELAGEFPPEISDCKALVSLNIYGNGFSGPIPSEIGALQELQALHLGGNNFHREIPEAFQNCSKLAFLDLSRNNFGGEVQPVFGRFLQLKSLILHTNQYSGDIEPSGILRLPRLEQLDLSYNNFSGELPTAVSNASRLRILILAYNRFRGEIPSEYGNLSLVQALDLSFNRLTGRIPPSIGNLKSLLWFTLANNTLIGDIPREIGNCSSLLWLNLANNRLSGKIPREISAIGRHAERTLRSNRKYDDIVAAGSVDCLAMTRWIPAAFSPLGRKSCLSNWDRLLKGFEILPTCQNTRNSSMRTISNSGYLQLTGNNLTGEIPPEIGNMTNLGFLLLGGNALSGGLPPEFKHLPLLSLDVSSNRLSGGIPEEIGYLRCLQKLDLSLNNFSGELPTALNRLNFLYRFNVSFNPLLAGVIPSVGQLATFTMDSFLGDPLLRGGHLVENLPDIDDSDSEEESTESGDENEGVITSEVLVTFVPSFVVFASASFYLGGGLWRKLLPAKSWKPNLFTFHPRMERRTPSHHLSNP